MFALIFTRLTNDTKKSIFSNGTEESIFFEGLHDTKEEAQEIMRKAWTRRITDGGWDPDYSYIEEDQAFCGTEDMIDTCRYYIFDTNHPYGFSNYLNDEFSRGDE